MSNKERTNIHYKTNEETSIKDRHLNPTEQLASKQLSRRQTKEKEDIRLNRQQWKRLFIASGDRQRNIRHFKNKRYIRLQTSDNESILSC